MRSGGRTLREGAAVRNAMLAVALAKHGHAGGETVLEGDAGFYHAYTGNNLGKLTYSFTGDTHTSLEEITDGLGKDWIFLETLYRIYSTAGYNIAHVDVTAALCEEYDIQPEDVDRVEAVVNWLETQYPSPAFPVERIGWADRRVGSTHYFSAYGVVRRGFPLVHARRGSARSARPDAARDADPVAQPAALRAASHHLHARRPELSRGRGPAASSSGTSRGGGADQRRSSRR